MEITDKNKLKVGDIIRFHNWGVGGFLFGLITECEEEAHTHNTTHIWRAKSYFSLNSQHYKNHKAIQCSNISLQISAILPF